MHANRIIPGGGIPDAAGVRSPRPASRSARRAATRIRTPGRFGEAELAYGVGFGPSDRPMRRENRGGGLSLKKRNLIVERSLRRCGF